MRQGASMELYVYHGKKKTLSKACGNNYFFNMLLVENSQLVSAVISVNWLSSQSQQAINTRPPYQSDLSPTGCVQTYQLRCRKLHQQTNRSIPMGAAQQCSFPSAITKLQPVYPILECFKCYLQEKIGNRVSPLLTQCLNKMHP